MTVELIPNCEHCSELGVSNATFFDMVNNSGMDKIIGTQSTNDPVRVSNKDALKLLELLKTWEPPENWGGGFNTHTMKSYFLDFFRTCNGFITN